MVGISVRGERQNQQEPSIFISHSSKDITVARAVRNLLEDRNHNFVELIGLASISGRTEDEIYQLLADEIAARDWLLLVDSDNTRQSPYVQIEIEQAKAMHKPLYTIDCDRFIDKGDRYAIEQSLRPCIATFSQSLRIFISYARHDGEFARQLSDVMQERNFEVWLDTQNITPGMNWQEAINRAIEETLETGVMIALISQTSLQSSYVQTEIEYAMRRGGMFIPVALEKLDYGKLPVPLQTIQFFDVSHFSNPADQIEQIIRHLRELRHRRFNEACGGYILNG